MSFTKGPAVIDEDLDDWDDGIELKKKQPVIKKDEPPKKNQKEKESDTLGFLKKAEQERHQSRNQDNGAGQF